MCERKGGRRKKDGGGKGGGKEGWREISRSNKRVSRRGRSRPRPVFFPAGGLPRRLFEVQRRGERKSTHTSRNALANTASTVDQGRLSSRERKFPFAIFLIFLLKFYNNSSSYISLFNCWENKMNYYVVPFIRRDFQFLFITR